MRIAALETGHPDVTVIADEGRGQLDVTGVSVQRMLELQAAAARGHLSARRLTPGVLSAVAEVNNPPPLRRPSCFCCGRDIRAHLGYVVGVVHAAVTAPEAALWFLLCRICCTTQAEFDKKAARIVPRFFLNACGWAPDRRGGAA